MKIIDNAGDTVHCRRGIAPEDLLRSQITTAEKKKKKKKKEDRSLRYLKSNRLCNLNSNAREREREGGEGRRESVEGSLSRTSAVCV